jgi:hypothetical protein
MSLSMPRGPSVVRTASATAWHALMLEMSCALPCEVSVPCLSKTICGCMNWDGCMAARIAFEISIYIRMRINMQNVERSITRRQRRNDGVCHRMITAKQQRDSICVHGFGHRL